MSRAKEAPPVQHPGAGEEWFRKLAPEKQEELNAGARREAAHYVELRLLEQKRILLSCGQVVVLYLVTDCACPGWSWGSTALVAVAGAVVGAGLERVHAGRVLSGSLGMVVFILTQVLTRGGVAPAHLFFFFVVAAIAAIFGLRRENGE